jgi:hypothetical protein
MRFFSLNVIRVKKSEMMTCVRHVAYAVDEKCIKTLIGKLQGEICDTTSKWEDTITMDGITRKLYGRIRTGFIWIRAGVSGELL